MKIFLRNFKNLPGLLKGGGLILAMCLGTILSAQTIPEFNDAPDDLTVQCIEDVPAQVTLTANSDCEPVEVSTFVAHTGGVIDSCSISTAYGEDGDWSIWLPSLMDLGLAPSENWNFQGNATFMSYDDNTASVTGVIANSADPSLMMYVEFWLNNEMNWSDWSALGRSYKNDAGFGTTTHFDWKYYEMVGGFSHIVGLGSLAGSDLFMSHEPSNYYYGFQCGMGANDINANNGMSGWFSFSGFYDGQEVSGSGDLNVDKDCGTVVTENCINYDEITYSWHAEDACGHMANWTQVITVDDNTAPVFTITPDDVTVNCQDWPFEVFSAIAAEDNCNSGIMDLVYVGEFVVSESPCESSYIRRWSATDYCDNVAFYDQHITVVDDEAPVFDGTLPDVTIECDEEIPSEMLTATDNCSEPEVVLVETIVGDECETVLTRTFTATDACGLSTEFVQTITIVDTTPPVFDDYVIELTSPCDEVLDLPLLTATDNCSTVEINYTDQLVSGGCVGVVVRHYTATDVCGNTSEAEQIITLTDTTPPVIANPADMTVECSDIPASPGLDVIVTDNCSDINDLTYEETIIPGDCENNYTILWHWTATDGCNNIGEATTTITVEDTTPPTWVDGTVPADMTFECSDDIPEYTLPSAQDNCDDDVLVDVEETMVDGACPNTYTIERTFTAYDNCGNSTQTTQLITVVDTTAPVFDPFEDLEMPCDAIEEGVFVTATDNCGNVTITVVDELVDGGCAGHIIKTYTATDECGNEATATQTVVLTDNVAPVFDPIEYEVEAACDEAPGSIYVTATDNCGEVTITVEDDYLSGGCAMTMVKTYTATDNCGNSSTAQQIVHLIDSEAPEFVTFPADVTVECDEAVPSMADGEAQITIADNCTTATLSFEGSETIAGDCPQNYTITYTWKVIDNCNNEDFRTWTITVQDTTPPEFTFVPGDVTLDCNDDVPASMAQAEDNCGTVSVTFEDETSGDSCETIVTRTFTATDECGNTAVAQQVFTKLDTTAPQLTVGEDMTLECNQEIPEPDFSYEDDCSEVTVDVESVIEDGQCLNAFAIVRTYTATDACGNTTVLTQTITIQDTTAPEFTFVPADVTIDCGDDIPVDMALANDNCDNDVSVTYEDETSGDSCELIITRTFTATDNCGNSTTAVQTITQVDTTAPVLNVGADMTLECDETIPEPEYTVEDDCSDVSVEVTSNSVDGDCPQAYVMTRTYVATDACGNSTTMTQTITIEDTTAPEFTNVPGDVTIDCGDDLPTEMAEASDNCGTVTISFEDETTGDSCEMITVRTFTAVDQCGNAATAVQTITKVDTTAPTLSIADDVTISCDEAIPAPDYTANDDCSGYNVDVTETTEGGDYCYVITRTYVATDDCGNASVPMVQMITVEDNVAPQINENPEDHTYVCPDDVPAFDDWSATDNCDPAPVVTTSWDYTSQDDCGNYVATVTCTATDACGNSSSVSFTVTVQDDEAPEFVNELEDLVIDCDDDVPAPADLTATDNCGGDVNYTVNDEIIGDLPDPDADLDCTVSTPETTFYPQNWGMLMYFGNTPFYGSISEGSFKEFPDGTAHLEATIVSNDNPSGGFFVDVWFMDGMDWATWSTQAFPTGYKDDFGTAGDNYLDWRYYILNDDNATMVGWGDYAGSFLTLAHAPSNFFYGFQIGVGANNVNTNYGGGGWFTYEGSFVDSSTDTNEMVTGGGDFAWNGDCCPDYMVERTYCAADCSGNETCFTQLITFDDLDGIVGGTPMGNTVVSNIDEAKSFDFVSIAPNPVSDKTLVEYRSNIDTKLRLVVVDAFGHQVDVVFEGDVTANTTYRKYISAENLAGGLYLLRLSSDDESTARRILISK